MNKFIWCGENNRVRRDAAMTVFLLSFRQYLVTWKNLHTFYKLFIPSQHIIRDARLTYQSSCHATTASNKNYMISCSNIIWRGWHRRHPVVRCSGTWLDVLARLKWWICRTLINQHNLIECQACRWGLHWFAMDIMDYFYISCDIHCSLEEKGNESSNVKEKIRLRKNFQFHIEKFFRLILKISFNMKLSFELSWTSASMPRLSSLPAVSFRLRALLLKKSYSLVLILHT